MLITVSTTLILGVLGFVVNSVMQRKNNSIKIITQYRLDRQKTTQDITARLLTYTDRHYYESLATEDERNVNIQNIVAEISNLRSIYHFSFKKDAELVQAAYTLKQCFCARNRNWNAINQARAEYARLSDVYTATDWKRIKLETVGKEMQSKKTLPKWTDIFNQNDSYFSAQNSINDVIFKGNHNATDD